jgi:hypothetical protein
MNLLPSRCGHVPVSATKPPSQPFSYSPPHPSNNYRHLPLTRRVPEIAVTFRPTKAEYFTVSLSIIQNTYTYTRTQTLKRWNSQTLFILLCRWSYVQKCVLGNRSVNNGEFCKPLGNKEETWRLTLNILISRNKFIMSDKQMLSPLQQFNVSLSK